MNMDINEIKVRGQKPFKLENLMTLDDLTFRQRPTLKAMLYEESDDINSHESPKDKGLRSIG